MKSPLLVFGGREVVRCIVRSDPKQTSRSFFRAARDRASGCLAGAATGGLEKKLAPLEDFMVARNALDTTAV
jgi:hypothetical protein